MRAPFIMVLLFINVLPLTQANEKKEHKELVAAASPAHKANAKDKNSALKNIPNEPDAMHNTAVNYRKDEAVPAGTMRGKSYFFFLPFISLLYPDF